MTYYSIIPRLYSVEWQKFEFIIPIRKTKLTTIAVGGILLGAFSRIRAGKVSK